MTAEKTWTYEGYWAAVLGPNINAVGAVREWHLDRYRTADLGLWLGQAEDRAWHEGGNGSDTPAEWDRHHHRALSELEAAISKS